MIGYVYLTTNLLNGKRYIGVRQKPSFDARYFGSGRHLKAALLSHGRESFKCEILSWHATRDDLAKAEIAAIAEAGAVQSDDYYNILPGGDVTPSGSENPFYGKTHSPELRAKWSKSRKGRKPIRPAGWENPLKGVSQDPDFVAYRTRNAKGRAVSDDARQRMSLAKKGKPGRQLSPDAIAKLAALHRGRKRSAETCERISASKRGSSNSPESNAKRSATQKGIAKGPYGVTECRYCGKVGGSRAMKRWHGENCKEARELQAAGP